MQPVKQAGKLPRPPCCELCNEVASVYCPSDSAFLCHSCDSRVHTANFLVARHPRLPLCSNCSIVCGFSPSFLRGHCCSAFCFSCSPLEQSTPPRNHDDVEEYSSSSSCLSTTEESTTAASDGFLGRKRNSNASVQVSSDRSRERTRIGYSNATAGGEGGGMVGVRARVEVVLENWCKRLGLDGGVVVPSAIDVLGVSLGGRLGRIPLRAAVAASFWVGMRICCGQRKDFATACIDVRKLEVVTGVPRKVILGAEAKLVRLLKKRRGGDRSARVDIEEGWAECSV